MSDRKESAAVALHYDGEKAPTVLASGQAELAEEILAIAREHEIPIYENPDLVNLLTTLSVGEEIPPELYRIIAEIIAFAFHIRGIVPEGFQPEAVSELGPYKGTSE
ncbi:MAG: EscU/YscU/HrcU family type III secretion system export apparatus switch protein [Natronospirillum sp.]|uniref:EscU/YscU/HrcU family type III secretion system export apparatus switch protein n=1 Tax=Natronospirillum sp. TaxID=2812955 RepID=UPI0025DEA534|nr:EscU/YscU/HrcU family type III secretion system export apparatus switch protein [Natronospirillum sp.]MCH8552161.1 EscU/YscU/HrcU family type III secretion system export apparatus switch protein [Natronospirillum sp.]